MAKKQFIRHLEYYGFPDQNGYSSDINAVDLSDIIKKNKEQDEEIADLEGEKADEKDLLELSGTVETLISAQTEFNNTVVETFTEVKNDINSLKDIDNEFAVQLSALTEGVNSVNENLEELSENTNEAVEALTGQIEELSGKSDTFALKEDTYTKQEVGDLLNEYATEEWVLSQGYLNQETGDNRYAQKETVDELSDRLDGDILNLQAQINAVSGDLDTYKTVNDDRINTLETSFTTLDDKVNRELEQISGDVETFDERIRSNTNAIADLTEAVNEKVNITDFNNYKTEVIVQFNNMDDIKADKSSVTTAMNEIATVDSKLTQEKTDRITADALLQGLIDNIDEEIIDIKEDNAHENEKITALEEGLAQEIADRTQGELNLIGTTSDTKDNDTIWGAKRFAQDQKGVAISEARTYTDNEIAGLRNEFEDNFEDIERELTAKADKTYVDASKNELKETLEEELESAITTEANRAQTQEMNLYTRVNANTASIQENDTKITNLATKVNCITEWNGTDPEQYDDSGNGILDTLHREVHSLTPQGFDELKAQVSANTEAITLKANSADVYTKEEADNKFLTEEAISGLASTEYVNSEIARVEEEIPSIENLATKEELEEALSGKADSDSVYTQEEVDALLAEKEAEYNRLKEMILDLYYANTFSIPADSTLDSMLKSKNGEAKLTEDVTTGTIAAGVTAKNIVKLNLGGKTVTFTGTTTSNPALMFRNKQQINIGGSGTIDAGGRIAAEANGTDCEITLSGTMFGRPTYITNRSGGELIYCYLGTINITDGIFKNLGADKTYLLNCYDANYKNGTAKIIVTGGKFYDFNPADNSAEGEHTSFVPEGYHVETSTDGDSTVYTVKKD